MSHELFGHLCGYLCDECREPLSGTVVRLYPAAGESVVDQAVADPKDTLRLLDEEEATSRGEAPLAEATVGDDGTFRIKLPESYDGGPVDVELAVGTVPGMKPATDPVEPARLHLTTLQPRWRKTESGLAAAFEYCLPARVWCQLRGWLGVWTICGSVTVCDTKQPVAGVTVRAFDADWLQDDSLGSGVTELAGHFRINYTPPAFKRTPFPWISFEWVSGPDVYFAIEGPGATLLLDEPRSKGRSKGRRNVGPCTCVDLCLEKFVPNDPIPTIPMFTKVGSYRVDPLDGHFAPDGTTAGDNLAFTGNIPLIGIMPDPLSPDSIEYRFTVESLDGGGTSPVDSARMTETVIGELQYFAWSAIFGVWFTRSTDFYAGRPGATVSIPQSGGPNRIVSVNTPIKAGGWIEAPRTNTLYPGGDGRFIPNGQLANLRTDTFTLESFDLTVPAPGHAAGDSVPAGSRSSKPTFGIHFEARRLSDLTSVGTDTLDRIAFSNVTYTYVRHPYWAGGQVLPGTAGVASLGVQEMVTNGGCADLGDEMHVLYTAYHPYVGQPTVYFDGNPILPAAIVPPVADDEAISPTGVPPEVDGDLVDITLLAKCAYILWLSVPLRLTSGFGSLGWVLYDHIAFCKK